MAVAALVGHHSCRSRRSKTGGRPTALTHDNAPQWVPVHDKLFRSNCRWTDRSRPQHSRNGAGVFLCSEGRNGCRDSVVPRKRPDKLRPTTRTPMRCIYLGSGGLRSPFIQPLMSVDFRGSGPSHSIQRSVLWPLPPGGSASASRLPHLVQIGRVELLMGCQSVGQWNTAPDLVRDWHSSRESATGY